MVRYPRTKSSLYCMTRYMTMMRMKSQIHGKLKWMKERKMFKPPPSYRSIMTYIIYACHLPHSSGDGIMTYAHICLSSPSFIRVEWTRSLRYWWIPPPPDSLWGWPSSWPWPFLQWSIKEAKWAYQYDRERMWTWPIEMGNCLLKGRGLSSSPTWTCPYEDGKWSNRRWKRR